MHIDISEELKQNFMEIDLTYSVKRQI